MPHTAGKRLTEAIVKQLERVEYFSSVENISPNVAVHEMRKTFKRLRALLKFYIEFPEEFSPDFSLQIKYFGRSLTIMRETYVNVQIFDRITSSGNLEAERKIKAAREKLTEKNRGVIEQGLFAAEGYLTIHNFVKKMNEQMEDVTVPIPSQQQFVRQLVDSYIKSYQTWNFLNIHSDPENMHELRKKMKQLYYQFDFIRYASPRFFKLKTYHLNNITEHLGEDHDLFVFLNELLENRYDFTDNELEILENQVQHLREVNRIKLFPKLKQFFNDSPEVFNQKLKTNFKVQTV